MPSSNFKLYSISFLALGVSLCVFNLFHWAQPVSVLAEIKPKLGRNIASTIDVPTTAPRKLKILSYDCSKPQDFETLHSEVRIALINCAHVQKTTNVFNLANQFQATLFEQNNTVVTDYIPLVQKKNTIELAMNNKSNHKIVVYRTTHDAR